MREIVLRQLHGGKPWSVGRAFVVRDDEDGVVLWLPGGVVQFGEGDIFGEWTLVERRRDHAGIVRVMPAGRRHSILHFRHPDGSHRGWYVNLEESWRTDEGFDFEDHILDLWIEPDGAWRWLDEDELADGLEGERVVAEWPFPTGWEDRRP